MDNDDVPVGRILSRREVLALFGATGAAFLAGCTTDTSQSNIPTAVPTTAPTSPPAPTAAPAATVLPTEPPAPTLAAPTSVATVAPTSAPVAAAPAPACVVRPETTEGPYFVDDKLLRADIRSDPATGAVSEGAPLALTFLVSQISSAGCGPLAGAIVDVWHCDANGVYSSVADRSFNTTSQQFLRGYQVTDANGQASFTTIYPGWYPGRPIHIHFKIRTAAGAEFTSQLFFDEALNDQVLANPPYAGRGQRNTLNSDDGIFRDELLLNVTGDSQGYAATFHIGLEA
jgi:protocatechuate 3,4-dioxygenase beta subunit